jgi:ABC-2 type transport system permease protein
MAVYEHSYRRYEGRLMPAWSRFLIIPRYAYQDVFRSKLFVAFFGACFIWPLVSAILIYLHHNTNAIALLQVDVKSLVPIDASFFQTYVSAQGTFAFFLNLLIGPPLISRDLANNGLPLYLCRPFSRVEYVLGKMSVLLILLSLITWVPGLLLYLFQAYLEGAGWFASNLRIAGAIFLGSLVWLVLLALLSLAISTLVKWRVVASAVLLGLFFIPAIFGAVVNENFNTRIGNLMSLSALRENIQAGLFGTFKREVRDVQERRGGRVVREVLMTEPPLWSSWLMLAIVCAVCLLLLARKVRAYEVIKS